MFKGIFKISDFILMSLLIVIGVLASVVLSVGGEFGNRVAIKVDGELYGTYKLSEDQVITVGRGGETNTVTIKDGAVSVTDSTCKNHVCVSHAPISKTGESIVCLPHKTIISIEGNSSDVDSVSS